MLRNANVLTFRPSAPQPPATPDLLIGPSEAIARLWTQIRHVAPYFRTALLRGEPGSGAEAVAHALHSLSPFRDLPFQVLDATAAAAQLATTSPSRTLQGTVFFPHLETFAPGVQSAVTRLQRTRRPQQLAIIASVSRDLRPLVSTGALQAGLAQAFSALQLNVPSLAERKDDIPSLAAHLLEFETRGAPRPAITFSAEFYDALTAAAWPGNLDQLRSTLRIILEHFPDGDPPVTALETLRQANASEAPHHATGPRVLKLDDVVREHIRTVLLVCNGNKLRAAETLGISRSTLYRMLDSYTTSLPLAG
ncbi:helix-turn-helix domain-containing protein [Granulicella cerasi]|uniref:Helix-turn-helix domain-containing protein n=1 Tax=Granulicella cerasi TaxID=741063 RepID=A0ABW1ZEF8_9BACT|nr:helix-turn-helix domain-containing protein [Granulicella cerasi]